MRQLAETGSVALDLANTWDEYLDSPERLPDLAALRRYCQELTPDQPREDASASDVPDLSETSGVLDVGEDDLVAVRAVRDRLRAVLAGEPRERARELASWVAELPVRAAVEDVDGVPRLRLAASDGADLAETLAVRAIRELLDLAADGDWARVRLCAATPCRDAFVDRSRPGRRQFCSTRCANRAHAAASRARHRS
ncbi:CGNR zinc finger domain-containing protein [Nonomuraea sp. NPDC048916]|uniref:CGNR zinc finger domain-containing protein n=1 Tax=Nonomuraea sp. NPDC048916 TaxID=3154232 RepID=UPI0033E8EFEB